MGAIPATLRVGGQAGGVLGLGPRTNTFGDATTADRAAAEALRDTYQGNNATWLAQYNNNRSFWIRLVWDDGTVEQRRNAAGDDWEDVTNVIRGKQGDKGDKGDAGAGVPAGGAIGDALVKSTAADRDTEWSSGVSENTESLRVIKAGELGHNWHVAIRDDFAFVNNDFGANGSDTVESEFPEIITPEYSEADKIVGVATPLDGPEAELTFAQGGGNILNGFSFRRQLAPLLVVDMDRVPRPYRLWKALQYDRFQWYSDTELVLELKPRRNNYPRRVLLTDTNVISANVQAWTASRNPVLDLGDFGGADKFVSIAVPATAPDPTYIGIVSTHNQALDNLIAMFGDTGVPVVLAGVEHKVWQSNAALPHATWSGERIAVLPEEEDIDYFTDPLVFPENDLGFTTYGGLYSFGRQPPAAHPVNPITAAYINAGVNVVSSMNEKLNLRTIDNLNAVTHNYVRFLAQPAGSDDPVGIRVNTNPQFFYGTLAEARARADLSGWTRQPDDFELGGVTYEVWLNRYAVNRYVNAVSLSDTEANQDWYIFR